jgi:hypothetical protein
MATTPVYKGNLTGDVTGQAGTLAAVTLGIPLHSLHAAATMKDAIADTPNGTTLGVADTSAALLTATTDNGVSVTETAAFEFAVPAGYTAGDTITVRIRAKISALPTVASSNTVDITAKLRGDAGLGSDICTTAAQVTTTSMANYDFVVTPTGIVAGDVIEVVMTLAANDTGGTTNGIHTVSKIAVLIGA